MTVRPRGGNFGKPDATGRSSGKLDRAERRLIGPPSGNPWTWLSAELLASDAWRGMSIYCRRFIEILMLEHCNHAGRENGRLMATYSQLKRTGIHERHQRRAIDEAVERGLVRVMVVGGLHGIEAKRTPSRYRLTWLGCIGSSQPATDEWRSYKNHFPANHSGKPIAYHIGKPTRNAPQENRHFKKARRPTPVESASRYTGREPKP